MHFASFVMFKTSNITGCGPAVYRKNRQQEDKNLTKIEKLKRDIILFFYTSGHRGGSTIVLFMALHKFTDLSIIFYGKVIGPVSSSFLQALGVANIGKITSTFSSFKNV